MRLEVYPNLTGMAGTTRTIAHMRRLVEAGKTDPSVVLQAHRIIKGIDRNNWHGMADAIFRFVHDRIAYVRDPVGVEFVKSPAITLKTKTGDCDDQAVLFSTLVESIGMKSRFKTVKADPRYPGEFSHVYSQVEIPKKGWVTGDTIVPQAKFGWEAKNFTSKTWPGVAGIENISFIDGAQAGLFGDVQLAAGSVGYDDDIDPELDTTFGAVFADAGGMWDTQPLLTTNAESIDTVIDADADFWGGATDTDPGPGFKSRMLTPGVGSMNGIQLARNAFGQLGYYDGMGKWQPFKRLKKVVKKVQKAVKKIEKKIVPKPFRKINDAIRNTVAKATKKVEQRIQKVSDKVSAVGQGISKGVQKFGKQLAKGMGMSTPEARQEVGKAAVEAIVNPLWSGPQVQSALEMDRRIQEFVTAQREGRMPEYAKGPPVSGMQGLSLAGRVGRMRGTRTMGAATAAMGSVTAAIAAVASVAKAAGTKRNIQAAQEAVDKYTKGLDARLTQAITDAATAYIAAGGMVPSESEAPPADWTAEFQKKARSGKSDKYTGWAYHDIIKLITDLESSLGPLATAKQVMGTAYNAYNAAQGPQTLQLATDMVEQAAQSGAISPDEVQEAIKITNLVAQGYALTPQQQALAARIAASVKKGGGKAWMVAIPAAVAAGAALLI